MCVLLVEDETLIREVMSECLQEAGFEVVEAENGVQALDMVYSPTRDFSILVTDFHMPGGVDGAQLATKVREALPAIPVVIATGRPDAIQPSWRNSLGYQVLQKPYLPSDLITLIRSLVKETPAA